MVDEGLGHIRTRMENNLSIYTYANFSCRRLLEFRDQFIVIDHQLDPVVYATGLELLIRIGEGGYYFNS
jgi:hypothetical protein